MNKEWYAALSMPGFSHFYCRASEVLHFRGNLSEETEGLILQAANTLIVLKLPWVDLKPNEFKENSLFY